MKPQRHCELRGTKQEAIQKTKQCTGLLRRYTPRNDVMNNFQLSTINSQLK